MTTAPLYKLWSNGWQLDWMYDQGLKINLSFNEGGGVLLTIFKDDKQIEEVWASKPQQCVRLAYQLLKVRKLL